MPRKSHIWTKDVAEEVSHQKPLVKTDDYNVEPIQISEFKLPGQAAVAKTQTIYKTGVKAKHITATEYEDQKCDYVGYVKEDIMVDDEVLVKRAVASKQTIEYFIEKWEYIEKETEVEEEVWKKVKKTRAVTKQKCEEIAPADIPYEVPEVQKGTENATEIIQG